MITKISQKTQNNPSDNNNLEKHVQTIVWTYHIGQYPIVVCYRMQGTITIIPNHIDAQYLKKMEWDKMILENAEHYDPILRCHLAHLTETITDIRPKRFMIEAPTAHQRLKAIEILSKQNRDGLPID